MLQQNIVDNPNSPSANAPLRIDYLRISVTDQCDLKGVCRSRGKESLRKSDILTGEEIIRLVQAVNTYGLKKVRLTGGEPLLREDIVWLVSALKRRIGIVDLSMTTNGARLGAMARTLKTAGLDRVNISLDTMDPKKFRTISGGGDIYLIWDALDAAEQAGLYPIKIDMMPLRGVNDDEIARFAALTLDHDYHVRFIEALPAVVRGWGAGGFVEKQEIMHAVSRLGKLVPLVFKGQGPSRNYRLPGARGTLAFISAADHFCSCCNRLRVSATGKARACIFSNEADLKNLLRKAPLGEIREIIERVAATKPDGHSANRPAAAPRPHALPSEDFSVGLGPKLEN